MSVRYRIEHLEKVGDTTTEYRVDILDSDYGGSVTTKKALGNFFELEYEELDPREPLKNPVQESSLTVHMLFESGDDTSIIDDIISGDYGRFELRYYINDTLEWVGSVRTDISEYPEGPYPWAFSITAKDLSILKGIDYPRESVPTRDQLSHIIADCLGQTGITLPIRSFTNLTHSNGSVDSSNDFLNELYHAKQAFQNKNTEFTYMEVLQHICWAYNLIIRQAGGKWYIEQITAVAKGDDKQFDYDSNGENPTSSTPARAITIDRDSRFVLPNSTNRLLGALKELKTTYLHRTYIKEPEIEDISRTNQFDPPTRKEFKVDGIDSSNEITISFDVEVTVDNPNLQMEGSAYFALTCVRSGASNFSLDSGGTFREIFQKIPVEINGLVTLSGSVNLTGSIPVGIDSLIEVVQLEFYWADATETSGGTVKTVTQVDFTNINLKVQKNVRDWDAKTTTVYKQSGTQVVKEEIPATVLGDGPSIVSIGAPSFTISGGTTSYLEEGGFSIRGNTESVSLQELTAREYMHMRRKNLKNGRYSLWGLFSPKNLINYRGTSWFFLGGRFGANGSRWDANLIAFDYLADTGDDFSEYTDDDELDGSTPTDFPGIFSFNAIGELLETVSGLQVTEIDVELDVVIRSGYEYFIVNENELSREDREAGKYAIMPLEVGGVTTEYGPGQLTLDIDEQYINAPEGSLIYKAPSQEEIDSQYPEFSFVSDTLEIVADELRATMDLIEDGTSFAKVIASGVNGSGEIIMGSVSGDLDDIDDGGTYEKVLGTQISAGKILLVEAVGDLDDIDDGGSFAKVSVTNISAGKILLAQSTGDIDDIDNGSTYGRVLLTSLSAGQIVLAEATGDLDDIDDGTNFEKVSATVVNSSGIVILSAVSGDLDDIDDGTNFQKVDATSVNSSGIVIVSGLSGDLDDLQDGGTYGRVKQTDLSAGRIQIDGPDGQTVIDQGVIDTDEIFASAATISNTLTMGNSAEIVGDNYTISDTGITVSSGSGFDITLGGSGEITNSTSDFAIDSDGFTLYDTGTGANALKFITGATTYGNLYDTGSRIVLSSANGHDVGLTGNADVILSANGTVDIVSDVTVGASGSKVGFYGSSGVTKQTLSGSSFGGSQILKDLVVLLGDDLDLFTNSTTP